VSDNRQDRQDKRNDSACHKTKVLIVDDNRELLATTFDILNHAGCETDLADSGYQAIVRCQEKFYDVVVLDIMMPGLNGVETLRAIRHQHPHTRFIVMTGYSASTLVADARAEGILDLFIKPVNPASLVSKIREVHPTRYEMPATHEERPVCYNRI